MLGKKLIKLKGFVQRAKKRLNLYSSGTNSLKLMNFSFHIDKDLWTLLSTVSEGLFFSSLIKKDSKFGDSKTGDCILVPLVYSNRRFTFKLIGFP